MGAEQIAPNYSPVWMVAGLVIGTLVGYLAHPAPPRYAISGGVVTYYGNDFIGALDETCQFRCEFVVRGDTIVIARQSFGFWGRPETRVWEEGGYE